ncbi:D-2-hydroxyacid dehydrogenase [Muricoccus radiodurans]|uniref:D-2-hydroxyacid dehydrogenase n=1 Tax=Muricoccus radiodurans TaxID=2231721 RepID=UPI003CEC0A76
MRLHVQNPPGVAHPVTEEQVSAALARHPDMAHLRPSYGDDDAAFAAGIADAEILLTFTREGRKRFPVGTPRSLAPKLRLIAFTSAGLDALQPFDWVPDGVTILNNRGTHGDKAGEYGIMAILMLQTRMPAFADAQREGRWQPLFATTLEGRTVVILGIGTLGGGVARRCKGFGMRVIGIRSGADPHPDCDETHPATALDEILPRADFLVLTCPLTPQTRNILSRERIGLLPRGARVVNMARGAVWDQDAIMDALDSGHLDGCVTDVAVPEPLPADHRLWRTPRMIITPHVSSDDDARYNERTLDILFENLRADREGRPLPNRVDPARGY